MPAVAALLAAGCGASERERAGPADVERAVTSAGLRICETRQGDAPPAARRQWTYVVADACPAGADDDVLVRVTDWDDEDARDFAAGYGLTAARRGPRGLAVRALGRMTVEISGPRAEDLGDPLLERLADEGAQ